MKQTKPCLRAFNLFFSNKEDVVELKKNVCFLSMLLMKKGSEG